MDNQPEALRLADWLDTLPISRRPMYVADELRRLHAENERLRIEAQNSKEAWDALTDHAGKVSAENERLTRLVLEMYDLSDNWPGIAYTADLHKRVAALKEPQ